MLKKQKQSIEQISMYLRCHNTTGVNIVTVITQFNTQEIIDLFLRYILH